jgi:hypothetical protein
MRRVQSPERSEQSRCDDQMRQMGWTVIKMSLRRPKVVLQTKGIPDRKFYRGGDTFWFECKAEDGRQSDEQKKFQEMCERAGELYVIGGLKEIMTFLKNWGEKVRSA